MVGTVAPTNAGRDRFAERDRFFIPAVRIISALAASPHAACKLVQTIGFDRETVDRALQWLKRRKLVEHNGAWCLTGLGKIAAGTQDPADPQAAVRSMLAASLAQPKDEG